MIAGPGGLEPRSDAWLGVSLLAPGVRYPDHDQPPRRPTSCSARASSSQDDGPWFEPGVGGSFHNTPGIRHAMRAGAAPLLARLGALGRLARPRPHRGPHAQQRGRICQGDGCYHLGWRDVAVFHPASRAVALDRRGPDPLGAVPRTGLPVASFVGPASPTRPKSCAWRISPA